jgi:hypothetical protein
VRMRDSDLVSQYAPEIQFSKGERYFPCPVFFSGSDIINNKEAYDRLTKKRKKELISCYYHIVEDQKVHCVSILVLLFLQRLLWSLD